MTDRDIPTLKKFLQPHVDALWPLIVDQCEGSEAKAHDLLEESLFMHDYLPVRTVWRDIVDHSVYTSSNLIDQFVRELLQ